VIVRATGFVRGLRAAVASHLTAHLKYIQYRSHELSAADADRRLFSADVDANLRGAAKSVILQHTTHAVGFHKLVLSPSAREAVGITDWQQWTRAVMRDLASRKGQELIWYAVKHAHTAHPHVHVVIAGSGSLQHLVRLITGDFKAMARSGSAHAHLGWMEQVALTVAQDQDRLWVERDFAQEQDFER
jgi:hypothetical protein